MPAAAGALAGLVLLAAGMRDAWALVAFALGAFVTATVAQEFWRGATARHRQYGEGYALATARLIGRNRRRYGGYVVHLGMVILFIGFAGMAFKTETQATLRPGEAATLRSPYGHSWTFTHLGVSQYDALNRLVTAGTVELARDGERVGILKSEKRQHVDGLGRPTFEPSTEVGIRSDLREDIYVVMAGVVGGTEQTVYRFTINPLVWWVWFGGYVLVLGGVIVMWPGSGPLAVRRTQAGYAVKLVDQAAP
jgi:cytochrome c-type biogenesis protein CcmF